MTVQFFEDGDAFRNTHSFTKAIIIVEKEDLDDDTYLTELLANHFSDQIDAIIAKEYAGAGYNITGVEYDDRYASLRIDIEE